MAKPYSQDLRDRVIDAVRTGRMSRRAAARHYAVSESVAVKWLERVERQGSREPAGHGGHRASKLMPHRGFLEAARAEKSDVTLQALCDRLLPERGVKTPTPRHRARWRTYQGLIDPRRLIFLDETWTKTNMTRLRGWAPKGERLIDKVPQGRWKTATFLAALRQDRIDAPLVLQLRQLAMWFCPAVPTRY